MATKNCKLGFSLLEILSVIAIIAILSAILLSVFARSKRQAKGTVDIAQLHQIGLAASIYTEDQGGQPYSVALLGHSAYGVKGILASPNDPSSTGMLNDFLTQFRRDIAGEIAKDPTIVVNEPLDVKASYVGIGDIHIRHQVMLDSMEGRDSQGWAISMIDYQADRKFPYFRPPYPYFRLLMDSSVQRKTSSFRVTSKGNMFDPMDLYGDKSANP